MKTVAIVQARSSSTRLPGKVLEVIQEVPMIIWQLSQLKDCQSINEVILATSFDKSDDQLEEVVRRHGFKVFRGDLNDVLKRFYICAVQEGADVVVRLTGDCPFTDPSLVDELVNRLAEEELDYIANNADDNRLSVPDGFDVEVFKLSALEKAEGAATLPSEREHVTPWMRKSSSGLRWRHFCHTPVRPYYRLTVDDLNDLEVVRRIVKGLAKRPGRLRIDEIIDYLEKNPEIARMNLGTMRNEGYLASLNEENAERNSEEVGTGPGLWVRAKKLIPGGNMLLSKRAEMFLPERWPSYFSRAKGCLIWDLDGRKYIDMSLMGVGTNTLGYGRTEVDNAVFKIVSDGNMSTLNCPEEVALAERLVAIHEWSDMVRFARTGGEANAIAIRIARAATGHDTVAICGYHGWHDWYLANNLGGKDTLSDHLLPGLQPNGVPQSLCGSVKAFGYNRVEELEKIISEHKLAAVKMEVERSCPPNPGFLEQVRDICSQNGVVLIFDECTSGFRETFGGLHKKYGINPDMAIFGKALGNGYGITAVIGRRNIMEAAQRTFISSTFWTERIGPAAGVKTLEIMEKEESWKEITRIGQRVRRGWQDLADINGLSILHNGLDALAGFSFNSEHRQAYKTLVTQEMLKQGYLASNAFYASIAHTEDIVDCYLEKLSTVFSMIAECENGRNPNDMLEGPIAHSGFGRLN